MKIPTKPAFTRRALLPLALALPLAASLLPVDARADVDPAGQRRVAPQGFSEQRFCTSYGVVSSVNSGLKHGGMLVPSLCSAPLL